MDLMHKLNAGLQPGEVGISLLHVGGRQAPVIGLRCDCVGVIPARAAAFIDHTGFDASCGAVCYQESAAIVVGSYLHGQLHSLTMQDVTQAVAPYAIRNLLRLWWGHTCTGSRIH